MLSIFSDDGKCLSSLEDTEWLSQISELLETATQVVVAMENDKSSVVIGYEDGMDRTAQVRATISSITCKDTSHSSCFWTAFLSNTVGFLSVL